MHEFHYHLSLKRNIIENVWKMKMKNTEFTDTLNKERGHGYIVH